MKSLGNVSAFAMAGGLLAYGAILLWLPEIGPDKLVNVIGLACLAGAALGGAWSRRQAARSDEKAAAPSGEREHV